MNNLEDFIFYDKIFNESQLSEIINKASLLKTRRQCDLVKNFSQKGNRSISYDIEIEESYHNIMITKYISSLPEKYRIYFLELLEKKYFADEKITKYDVNDDYGWHTDFSISYKGCRCISTITYLNENYCGGTTEFFGKRIQPKKGNTLIFPSFWLYPHKGSPVTLGSKLIYVCHFWITPQEINCSKNNSFLSYF